jgi:hypothetical protein
MAEGTGEFGPAGARGRCSGDDHVSAAGEFSATAAEVITEYALDPVADHGAAVDLSRNRESKARGTLIGEVMQGQNGVCGTTTAGEDSVEFRTRAYPRGARVSGGNGSGATGGHERRAGIRTPGPEASDRLRQGAAMAVAVRR